MKKLNRDQVRAEYYKQMFKMHLNDASIDLCTRVKNSYPILKWLVDMGYERSVIIRRIAFDMEIDKKTYGILLQHNPKAK